MANSSSVTKESGPGERNPILLKRILVPIDFSEFSIRIPSLFGFEAGKYRVSESLLPIVLISLNR